MPENYGKYGGIYMPELLMAPLEALIDDWKKYSHSDSANNTFLKLLKEYAGRPTPLTTAPRFSSKIGSKRLYLKREDLLHTGAHKLNNALGQCLLAKSMGKTRIIAETGAGQHGVATAAACAHENLECDIFMGEVDIKRQAPNVTRMRLMGANVISVETGTKTLKDAINAALRDWAESFETTHYCLGSALGPYPYPEMVEYFQKVIGEEARAQILEAEGRLPDVVIACVGGGSNAIGIFHSFIEDPSVALIGVEAGGLGIASGQHAARFQGGSVGVLHGSKTFLLNDEEGQIMNTHSISAGLDYPAVGPMHAYLHDTGRAEYTLATDDEALEGFKLLCKLEGIIPALESSHALGYLAAHPERFKDKLVVLNLSGRGDKDLPQLMSLGVL